MENKGRPITSKTNIFNADVKATVEAAEVVAVNNVEFGFAIQAFLCTH